MSATPHFFNLAQFNGMFPALASIDPTALSGYWTLATQYISAYDALLLCGDPLQAALNLLTAHLAASFRLINANKTPAVVTSAQEGSVIVLMEPPPSKNGWQYWLSSTPYGIQLWALLNVQSAGGAYVGGSLDRFSFRGAGGYW